MDSLHLGELGIFIDKQPELVLMAFEGTEQFPELHGKCIFIGGKDAFKTQE